MIWGQAGVVYAGLYASACYSICLYLNAVAMQQFGVYAAASLLEAPCGALLGGLCVTGCTDCCRYQAKVRELLNRAQAKPGARQPALQPQGLQTQQLQHAQLQQLGGHEQVNPGVDELSMQQQLLREQYQQPEYWRQQDEHDPRYSSSPADITSAPPDVMGGDFQDHLEDQPQQQEQQEDEQAARDSVPPPDLGLYDQQAQQLAEELRRLQDAMLGQPAAAADGTGAAAAGFDPGLTSPAGAAATAALLQLQGGVAVKAELW